MYDFELNKIIVILISLVLVLHIFSYTIRKLLGVDKKKWFSYNYINERHKKLDWYVRIAFIILLIFFYFLTLSNTGILNHQYLYLLPGISAFIFLIISELLRAFMEWKYAENKKAYIATIIELCFAISITIWIITTYFSGIV